MKLDQMFDRVSNFLWVEFCSRNGSHCKAILCNTSHSYVTVTIIIIIVLLSFQKRKQSDLEHFSNVDM